jgi:hypothetical protein
MVTHDPFCPARNHSTTWEPEMCVCDLIAKARADERDKAGQRAFNYSIDKLFTGMETADWIDGIVAAAYGEAS